ncbi:MAG: hypothetical protein AAFP04_07365 [Myxococcota bacterium]
MVPRIRGRNRIGSLGGALVAMILLQSGSAWASFKTVTVQGAGMDEPAAVRSALRKAIEEAGGVKITSASQMENYQLVLDTVIATSTGTVKSYDVLKRSRSGGLTQVQVKAVVSDENLFDDFETVRVAVRQKGAPKVLVMIAEQNVGSQEPSLWWTAENARAADLDIAENYLMKRWDDLGMRFVDRQAVQGSFSVAQPSAAQVKEFANGSGADVVVMGKALATMSEGKVLGTSLKSVRGQVSLRVLYVDSGEIIATATKAPKPVLNVNGEVAGAKVLQQATAEAADELLAAITKRWTSETSGPQRLEVSAKGFKRSRDFRKFMEIVRKEVSAVQDIQQRGYSRGNAKFDVVFTGNAFEFGDALETRSFPGFSIELEEVSGNTLTFVVTK